MARLSELTTWLDDYLRTSEVGDYSGALNGLQLETKSSVIKIAAAVDVCGYTIRAAVEAGAQLLLVHHGLFWSAPQPFVGGEYRKLAAAIQGGLAVYSSHLPLDIHPEVGNNAVLARELGLTSCTPFLPAKGQPAGLLAETEIHRAEFIDRLDAKVPGAIHILGDGPQVCRRIGIVTGGAGSEVAVAAAAGVDTFVTGEAPHWAATAAEDLGINLILGGHYATETFGVKALSAKIADHFGLDWEFLDHPTGL